MYVITAEPGASLMTIEQALFHQFAAGDFRRAGDVEVRQRINRVGFQIVELHADRLVGTLGAAERLHHAFAPLGRVELPADPTCRRRCCTASADSNRSR